MQNPSISKFQELVSLRIQDCQEAYSYAEASSIFIDKLHTEFARYLQCDRSKISILKLESGTEKFKISRQDQIEMDDDAFFIFGLSVNLHDPNYQFPDSKRCNCKDSLWRRGLLSARGLAFPLGIKPKEEDDEFLIKVIGSDRRFTANPKQIGSFAEIFQFLSKEMNAVVGAGFRKRMERPKDSGEKPFSFAIPVFE